MTRRYGPPRARPGQLKVQYGKAVDAAPGLVAAWGADGATRQDGAMLWDAMTSKRLRYSFPGMELTYEKSLIEELEERGYDITTLRFSIEMKKDQQDTVITSENSEVYPDEPNSSSSDPVASGPDM